MATAANVLPGSAEDTHVPALDDDQGSQVSADAGDGSTVNQQGDESDDSGAPTDDGDASQWSLKTSDGEEVPAPESILSTPKKMSEEDVQKFNGFIHHFAQRTGLDPANPRDLKTLETLAHKEMFIAKLQGQVSQVSDEPEMTEFEKSLLEKTGDGQQQQGQQQGQQQQGQQQQRPPAQTEYPFRDAGVRWKSAGDAYQDLGRAWSRVMEAQERNDPELVAEALAKVGEIDGAIFRRRAFDELVPEIGEIVKDVFDNMFSSKMGDLLPEVKGGIEERRIANTRESAINDLATTKGFEDVRSMYDELEGPPIEFNGESYPRTPLNLILAKMPGILNIQVQHKDRATADRLTFIERLRTAHAAWKSGKINAGKAKVLVEAGRKAAQRTQAARSRQSVNAGGGPANNSGAAGKGGYVNELLSTADGEKTFSSL